MFVFWWVPCEFAWLFEKIQHLSGTKKPFQPPISEEFAGPMLHPGD